MKVHRQIFLIFIILLLANCSGRSGIYSPHPVYQEIINNSDFLPPPDIDGLYSPPNQLYIYDDIDNNTNSFYPNDPNQNSNSNIMIDPLPYDVDEYYIPPKEIDTGTEGIYNYPLYFDE